MKNTFHKAIAATALLALGFAAAPAFADAAADKITSYVEIARSVFGGDKTAGDVVSAALAAAADKGVDAKETVGELSAALSAAEVAKDDPAVLDALAGIVAAVADDAADYADRAAAAVAAVTDLDVASALSDEALSDAAKEPDSVLDATEKAGLKDLYEKVLAALKGNDYKMKEDGDKAATAGKGKKGKKGKNKGGDEAAAAAAAAGAEAAAQASDGSSSGSGTAGGSEGGKDEEVVYGDDENLGDPLDQTLDPVAPPVDPDDPSAPYGPHEYRPTTTTLSGTGTVVPPVTPTTSKPKPKPTKPSPTPVGLR